MSRIGTRSTGRHTARVSLQQPLEVGEQLGEGRWLVEQVVPSPDSRVDFEARTNVRIVPGEGDGLSPRMPRSGHAAVA